MWALRAKNCSSPGESCHIENNNENDTGVNYMFTFLQTIHDCCNNKNIVVLKQFSFGDLTCIVHQSLIM